MSKKRLKQERAKIKLKAKKTILPKGQNITDTNFKVKKIVIQEQLRAANEDDHLSSRKLNVKELLTRIRHTSVPMQEAGLDGLQEITNQPGAIQLHLAPLAIGLAETSLHIERKIRKKGIKLLGSILKHVDTRKIEPVFPTLASYLGVAMTHLTTNIRETSLLLLDSLLDACPSLVADHSAIILPNFLNMVSKLKEDGTKSRLLTVNLDSRLTSITWRNSVLDRLQRLLAAMASVHSKVDGLEVTAAPEVTWDGQKRLTVPLCDSLQIQCCHLFSKGKVGTNESTEMTTHLEQLMPLLFQTWIEDAPAQDGAAVLTAESADLLGSVLKVIQLSWDLLVIFELQSQAPTLTKWFKESYEAEIKKHLMPGFPYSYEAVVMLETGGAEKREGTKKKRQTLPASKLIAVGRRMTKPCLMQNLALCHLLCCVHDSGDADICRKVVAYLTEQVGEWRKMESEPLTLLIKVVRLALLSRSKQWMTRNISVDDLLSAVLRRFHDLSDEPRAAVWQLFGDLALDPCCKHLSKCPGFVDWRRRLPVALTMPQVSFRTVRVLGQLAIQRDEVVLAAFREQLPATLSNLSNIEVIGAPSVEAGRRMVGDVLFWVAGSAEFKSAAEDLSRNCNDDTKIQVERINNNWGLINL